jgi:hypothetical protein
MRLANPVDVPGVIQREHDALAAETRLAQCPPLVAVNNMEDVGRVPTKLRWNHPTSVTALSGAKGAAFVVDCPSLESTALWVGTDNDDYRNAYLEYLRGIYHLQLAKIPAVYDVDHLYNRSRARGYGLQFIRVALVVGPANRSHGGAYEKDITTNEAMRVRKDMKVMDEISSMKYFGFLSPLRNDPRESEIGAYANFASTKLGLDPSEVRQNILYLREKASTPWAKKP